MSRNLRTYTGRFWLLSSHQQPLILSVYFFRAFLQNTLEYLDISLGIVCVRACVCVCVFTSKPEELSNTKTHLDPHGLMTVRGVFLLETAHNPLKHQ